MASLKYANTKKSNLSAYSLSHPAEEREQIN